MSRSIPASRLVVSLWRDGSARNVALTELGFKGFQFGWILIGDKVIGVRPTVIPYTSVRSTRRGVWYDFSRS